MAKNEERRKARQLRQQGWRIKDIAEEVGIRRDTVSKWCRDIELTPEQVATIAIEDPKWLVQHEAAQQIKQDALEQRIVYQEAGRERARTGSDLHLLGCMLYWGEGAKGRNSVQFTNTDSDMLRLFVKFLRSEFKIRDEDFYVQIMHHTTDESEIERIKQYWLEYLQLPANCKVNMQHKKGTNSRKARYENGICQIAVNNTEILHHIYGAIQEYIGFENPDWLN